jgi:DNA-binding beta-propeller fold protein YncE
MKTRHQIVLAALLFACNSPANGAEFFVTCLNTHNGSSVWRFNDRGVATPYLTGIASPSGIAMDHQNNLYVASLRDGTITRITPQGARSIFASGLQGPWGIAFSPGGDLFVANNNNYSISRISPDGGVHPFVNIGIHPGALAFDAAGNLYTPGSSTSLLKITPDGKQTLFATGLQWPSSLAFDPSGMLYVNNAGTTHSISRISPDGTVSQFVPPSTSWASYGLAFASDGNLYVTDGYNRIDRVGPNGLWDVVVPYSYGFDSPAYLVEIVPEPATGLVISLGGLMFWCLKRPRSHTKTKTRRIARSSSLDE